jgi:hypothetical protein
MRSHVPDENTDSSCAEKLRKNSFKKKRCFLRACLTVRKLDFKVEAISKHNSTDAFVTKLAARLLSLEQM